MKLWGALNYHEHHPDGSDGFVISSCNCDHPEELWPLYDRDLFPLLIFGVAILSIVAMIVAGVCS